MDNSTKELLNRLEDYIFLAQNRNVISTTRFLNPVEQSYAISKLSKTKGISYHVDGGYLSSERNVITIYPDDIGYEVDAYLAVVKVEFTKYDTKYINHRMILGSVLSLGITRDGIGDIIIDGNTAYIVATIQMAEYITDHLLYVARAHVSTSYIPNTHDIDLDIKEPDITTGTIASLRIDCVLALALRTSRTKTAALIYNQLVYINWQLVTKTTQLVQEGQIITVRKKGRIVLKSIGNLSKKDRTWVEVEVYF